jgi:hypothetical protein
MDLAAAVAYNLITLTFQPTPKIGIGDAILHVIPERRFRRIRDLTKRFGS